MFIVIIMVILSTFAIGAEAGIVAKELRCEYAENPLGIDVAKPRFGWVLESNQRGQMQSGWQILVAGSEQKLKANEADKWDSGQVVSGRSVNVVYDGSKLSSGEKCYWKVRCWDKNGDVSEYSPAATFEMGLLDENDWHGKWIGLGSGIGFVKGKVGKAVTLDGKGQAVRIPHYAALKPDKQITICAWIKPGVDLGKRPAGQRENWREIYRKEDGQARQLLSLGAGTGAELGTNYIWFGLGIAGEYKEDGAEVSFEGLKDGQWHLVVATYDGAFKRIYLDGVEIGKVAASGAIDVTGTDPGFIGSYEGHKEFFCGGIDDVRIYRRALSLDEIKVMVEDGLGGDGDIVGWWKLDGDLTNSVAGTGGQERNSKVLVSSPMLRKEFEIAGKVKRARMYITGLSWYELYINGKKVGDHVLDPAMTNYRKRILYATYDVTDMLNEGSNAMGAMLGKGWFCEPEVRRYGDSPCLLAQMEIEFADGSTTNIKSDSSWKISSGPIIRDNLSGGETYDGRLEKKGWAQADYDDSQWGSAREIMGPGGKLESQMIPAIKVNQTVAAVKLSNPKDGIYVYDMGRNFSGWAKLHVKGKRGTKVTIKYSERLFADSGLVDKRNYPAPKETDYYILKGDPEGEVYEPRFTFHCFRYVQIEGYPGVPTIKDVEGQIIYSSVDISGGFECSNALFNKIHDMVFWTVKNAWYGMPLDAPHREPFPYLEPAETPANLYSRKHMPQFWTKWLNDAKHAQRGDGSIPAVVPNYALHKSTDPAWSGNYPIAVWYVYQYYDDRRILKEHYESMKRWLDFVTSTADGYLVFEGTWGDHMLPGVEPGKEEYISSETPPALCWTGTYYRNASIVAQAARVLGKRGDAERYAKLAEDIKNAFNDKWFNGDSNNYATGSQTANLLALAIGVVPKGRREAVAENVASNIKEKHGGHLHTGIIGTTAMMETLTEDGQGEVMYGLVNKTTYPGWGYMVAEGATTVWETWGRSMGRETRRRAESMAMFSTLDEFFYSDLAGIKGPDYYGGGFMEPGFGQIRIKPYILGDLSWAGGSIKTVRGMVISRWKRTDDSVTLEVVIPVNSKATVSVPRAGLKGVSVTEGGEAIWEDGKFIEGVLGITGGSEAGDYVIFDVGSGSYVFVLTGDI